MNDSCFLPLRDSTFQTMSSNSTSKERKMHTRHWRRRGRERKAERLRVSEREGEAKGRVGCGTSFESGPRLWLLRSLALLGVVDQVQPKVAGEETRDRDSGNRDWGSPGTSWLLCRGGLDW